MKQIKNNYCMHICNNWTTEKHQIVRTIANLIVTTSKNKESKKVKTKYNLHSECLCTFPTKH